MGFYDPPPGASPILGLECSGRVAQVGRRVELSAGQEVCALLAGTPSIREVIAFPKTGGGYDPLTGAPAPITEAQRKEAGVDARPGPGSIDLD